MSLQALVGGAASLSEHEGVGVDADRQSCRRRRPRATAGSITSGWLQLKSHQLGTEVLGGVHGIDDRLARAQARLVVVDELVVERERDPQRRRLDGGRRARRARSPTSAIDDCVSASQRSTNGACSSTSTSRIGRASSRTNRSGWYEPSTGGRQPATRTPGERSATSRAIEPASAARRATVALEPLLRRRGTGRARRRWW